jgi:predicted DNA-binding transcriptional regulator YafY
MSVKNLERRFDMCSYILEERITHYENLMEEFNISKSTAIRDVRFISDYLLALETQAAIADGRN